MRGVLLGQTNEWKLAGGNDDELLCCLFSVFFFSSLFWQAVQTTITPYARRRSSRPRFEHAKNRERPRKAAIPKRRVARRLAYFETRSETDGVCFKRPLFSARHRVWRSSRDRHFEKVRRGKNKERTKTRIDHDSGDNPQSGKK